MKKIIAILVAFVMLFSAMTFSVSAAEIEQSGYESLVAKASAAFPEYAEKMQNPNINPSVYARNPESRELLVNETRSISDKESITYTEYSDGLILLSGYEFTAKTITVDRVTNSSSTNITLNIEATCVNDTAYHGYFHLDGVKYTLRSSAYDSITNTGTAWREGYCNKATRFLNNPNETATSYAELGYELHFQIGPGGYYTVDSVLILWVGDDTAVLEHIDHNDYV